MEPPEKVLDQILVAVEGYLDEAFSLEVFEDLQFTYALKKSGKGSSIQLSYEKIFSITDKLISQIKCLLDGYKNVPESGLEARVLRKSRLPIIKYKEDSDESQNDRSSLQLKTRRQRILRETQEKHQESATKGAPSQTETKTAQSSTVPPRPKRKKETKEWQCGVCSRIFSSLPMLEKHSKIVHLPSDDAPKEKLSDDCKLDRDSVGVFCCCQCFLSFKDSDKFDGHDCNLKEDELEELDEPMRSGRDRLICRWDRLKDLSLLICEQCREEYRSLRRMVYHLSKCTPGPYSCEICSTPFDNKKELNYHKKQKHKDTLSFFCDDCDARYKNRPSLQKHMVLKHERSSDTYDCDECEEVFAKKILLTRHKEKKHNLIKKFLCQICGEGLSNQQSLQLHVGTHSLEKRFRCDFCDASFHRKDKLIFHRRTHTGEKPFECDQCQKKFIRKAKLMEHLDRHKGLKNHTCEMCPKKYSGSYDLRVHMKKTHGIDTGPVLKLRSFSKKENKSLKEQPSVDEDDSQGQPPVKEAKSLGFQSAAESAAEDDSQLTIADQEENVVPNSLGSFVPPPSSQTVLAPQPVLHDPGSLAVPQSLASQTTHFYHLPQTVQIQVPLNMTSATLDLSQVGAQQIILTNFDFNSMNNLQF